MNIPFAYRTVKNAVLDLVFPVLCVNCGTEGTYLCGACKRSLKRNEFQICPACGHMSPFGLTHQACRVSGGLDGLITCAPYKDPLVRRLVELMKYHYISDIAGILGMMAAEAVHGLEMTGYFSGFAVVPLPLHKSREQWRGYNQAALMARAAAQELDLPAVAHYLVRVKKTRTQAELPDNARGANVKDAFLAPTSPPEKVILMDDVSTTRSTLSQACLALKKSGARTVWGLAFAQG